MDSRNTHLKGTRWKNLSRNVHGEVVLRQYSEHNAEQQEQEQYKEPHEEPMLTSPLWPSFVILRFLLLNECELSLKVLVLVINVALAYTAVPLLRRRRRRRRGSGCEEEWC